MKSNDKNNSTVIINKRYELHETLGRGGMGVVYKATDILSGRPVALKQVTIPAHQMALASRGDSPDLAFTLAQEFGTLATMRHPHIISVFDYGFDQHRQPYFTMEYIDGGQTILDFGRGGSLEHQVTLFIQMLQALVYLHRRGILHRDMKPSNALVVNGQIKLLDFGLSVLTGRTMEHLTQTTAGTMAYMAPELFQGEPYSQASDLYALGLIAFELFSGKFPYDQSTIATMIHDVLSKQIDTSSYGVADNLALVFNRLLTKSREERYSDAAEVIADLCTATNTPAPPETVQIRESFLQAARFVGREVEMAKLTGLLKQTAAGHGVAILIGGESGVGKSRLLDELRTKALVEGILVLRGQAISDGHSPYQLWRDVLSTAILYTDLEEDEAALFKPVIPDLERLLNRRIRDLPPLNPQTAQKRLSQSTNRLLSRLEQPVLIILEDMQWAGSESIKLLRDLSLTITKQPVMLAGNFREETPLTIRNDVTSAEYLRIDRLTGDEIAELSESMLGRPGRDPKVIELLQRETEGNAFFLVEVVRALAEEAGQLDRISTTTIPDNIVAGGIKSIINHRLNRVPHDARPLLQLASVAGRVLDLTLIQALEPEVNLDRWLATCTDVTVLEVYGENWRFSHDKLREEIKDRMSHDLHHDLHRRVAKALEMVYPNIAEKAAAMAHHWAVAGDLERELSYSEIAGRQAAENNANEEAITYFERTLELLLAQPKSAERDRKELNLQISLGPPLMALRGFNAPEVKHAYGRARELAGQTGQIDLLFHATWGQWEFYSHSTREDLNTAEELEQQLFELAGQAEDDGLLLEAHHSGWATAYARGNAAGMVDHARQGLTIYERGDFLEHLHIFGHDPGVCAYGSGAVGLWLLGYPEQARQLLLKGVALADEIEHPFSITVIKWGETLISLFDSDNQLALTKANEYAAFSKEHGFSGFARIATLFQGIASAQMVGGAEQMERMRSVYELAFQDRTFVLWPWTLSKYMEACQANGNIAEGIQAFEKELAENKLTGQRFFESEVRRQYGKLIMAKDEGQMLEAENQFQLAREIAIQQKAKSLELRAEMSLAELWQRQGRREQACRLLAKSFESFTKGFDTADLVAAKQLLRELE
jgi:predicted ATPase